MAIKGYELIDAMEQFAPSYLAVNNDRIGLQVGEPNARVNKVLVTLDVTEEVVDEAIEIGANWVIAHHAVIFQPLKAIRTDTAAGRLLMKCIRHQINIYIAHTNLDITFNGVNDVLAERLGLRSNKVLIPEHTEQLKKLVVFIPESHVDPVREALSAAGAGWIGNYSDCTFQLSGTGTFMPREDTNPFIGSSGKLEKVKEVRLETIITEKIQQQVVEAMMKAHPYEEVAYDVYPLDLPGKSYGLGRIGNYPQAITLEKLVEEVKRAYGIQHLRYVGSPSNVVRKIAILGGSGARYWKQAFAQQADVYITGDIDYHTAQDALSSGLCLIDPGHHVESLVNDQVCKVLREQLHNKVECIPSSVNTNPFQFS